MTTPATLDQLGDELLNVLNQHQTALNTEWKYPQIRPFTKEEIADFMHGRPGPVLRPESPHYTRSSQVGQALSAIGCHLIARDKADENTQSVYNRVHSVPVKGSCVSCGSKITGTIVYLPVFCNRRACTI